MIDPVKDVWARMEFDATSNLARSRAWLFAGHADETVYPAVVYALREFYAAYQTQVALVAN